MVNENLINLVNNKKPVELVQEIDNKYKIPTFEEFMKTYEGDNSLNYDDLSGGDIGEVKGYGPCTSSNCTHSREELQNQLREAERELEGLRNQLSRANSWNITVINQNIIVAQQKITALMNNIQNGRGKEFALWVDLTCEQRIGEDSCIKFKIPNIQVAKKIRDKINGDLDNEVLTKRLKDIRSYGASDVSISFIDGFTYYTKICRELNYKLGEFIRNNENNRRTEGDPSGWPAGKIRGNLDITETSWTWSIKSNYRRYGR